MKINVTILPPVTPPPNPTGDIRTVIDWDNPVAIQDGFWAGRGQPDGQTAGQFAFFAPYILSNGVYVGSDSANDNSSPVTVEQMQRIAALQDTTKGYTLKQIMGWLTYGGVDGWGAPMKCKGDDWTLAVNARIIAAVYCGGLVEVLEQRTINTAKYGNVPMCRIKTGWDQVHKVRGVDRDNSMVRVLNDSVYLPLLAGRWANVEWWLPARWLK